MKAENKWKIRMHIAALVWLSFMIVSGTVCGQTVEGAETGQAQKLSEFMPEFEKARQLVEEGNWLEAESILQKLHETLSANRQVINNLAVVYFYQGRIDEGIELLTRKLAEDEATRTLFLNLQMIYGYRIAEAAGQDPAEKAKPRMPALLLSRSLFPQSSPGMKTQKQENANDAKEPEGAEADMQEDSEAIRLSEPASLPVIEHTAEKMGDTPQDLVRERLNAWAKTWSNGAAKDFISFYLPDYEPEGLSHRDWVLDRSHKILPSREIAVEVVVQDIHYDVAHDEVEVVFLQRYRSRTYADIVVKRQIWVPEAGNWRIKEESLVKADAGK